MVDVSAVALRRLMLRYVAAGAWAPGRVLRFADVTPALRSVGLEAAEQSPFLCLSGRLRTPVSGRNPA